MNLCETSVKVWVRCAQRPAGLVLFHSLASWLFRTFSEFSLFYQCAYFGVSCCLFRPSKAQSSLVGRLWKLIRGSLTLLIRVVILSSGFLCCEALAIERGLGAEHQGRPFLSLFNTHREFLDSRFNIAWSPLKQLISPYLWSYLLVLWEWPLSLHTDCWRCSAVARQESCWCILVVILFFILFLLLLLFPCPAHHSNRLLTVWSHRSSSAERTFDTTEQPPSNDHVISHWYLSESLTVEIFVL